MQISSLIVEDFLEDYPRWREWLDTAVYGDVRNEVDGVTYPGICADIPAELRGEIFYKLQACAGMTKLNYLFARLSYAGVPVPHVVHNDASMGSWSCMLYLNREYHCYGGTALYKHTSGREPTVDEWRRDTNAPERWIETMLCPMVENRAFIFRSDLWHAARPYGGFGSTPQNGRVVLTAMFS